MPGGGGLVALNYVANVAPRDGTVLTMITQSFPMDQALGVQKNLKVDLRTLNWIGNMSETNEFFYTSKSSPTKTLADARVRETPVAATGAGSIMTQLAAVYNNMLGTRFKVIYGYPSGPDMTLAMERGEVEGRCGGLMSSINSTRPDWFPQNKVTIPFQIALTRSPLLPEVPALGEFAKDERTRQILALFTAPESMDRPILVPAGAPTERVTVLHAAFHAAMNDPGFIAEAKRQHLHIEEIDGPTVAKILADAYALPTDVVKAVNDMTRAAGAQNSR
jgi:tripartite-type tricarboxylate transporter receptor subunit TctC